MTDEELSEIERVWAASFAARKEPPPERAVDAFAHSDSGEWALEPAWEAALDAAHTHVPKLLAEVKRLRAPLPGPEFAEIERVWSAATPGSWRVGRDERYHVFCSDGALSGPERVLLRMNEHFPHELTAAAIAKAPEHVATLLAEVKRLRNRVAELGRMCCETHERFACADIALVGAQNELDAATAENERLKVEVEQLRAVASEWTSEKPTEPGSYWYRPPPAENRSDRLVRLGDDISHSPALMSVWEEWPTTPRPIADYPGQWAGPLVPPPAKEG